jgi:hypothetical protein
MQYLTITTIIFSIISLLISPIRSEAQQLFPTVEKSKGNPPVYHVQLNEAVIVSSHIFSNDTDRYRYNQMKHYVKIVLPYANEAIKTFYEIQEATADMNKRNKRRYIKSKEQEIKTNFEDKIKELNITQGRLLVKLINRQLKTNCYDIVKELKNPVSAAYYQSWARLNGINLNERYIPENEPELERIMRSLGY